MECPLSPSLSMGVEVEVTVVNSADRDWVYLVFSLLISCTLMVMMVMTRRGLTEDMSWMMMVILKETLEV